MSVKIGRPRLEGLYLQLMFLIIEYQMQGFYIFHLSLWSNVPRSCNLVLRYIPTQRPIVIRKVDTWFPTLLLVRLEEQLYE